MDAGGLLSGEIDDQAVFATLWRGATMRLRAALATAATARVSRFLAVGLLNTAFGYALFYAALRLTSHPIAAAAISTTLGALFNFMSIGTIVFGSSDRRLLKRFIAVYGLVFLANSAGLLVLERCGSAPALAQALLLPALAALSYRLNRDFVFADPRITSGAA